MTEESILDARLAEIDRRLRTIQSGLAAEAPTSAPPIAEPRTPGSPSAEPGTPAEAPAAAAGDVAALAQAVAELRDLTAAHQRQLDAIRPVLSSVADALARPERPGPHRPPTPPAQLHAVPAPPRPSPAPDPIGVAAGPFASPDALRRFERTLSALPEVRQVTVREFVGADRAVLDVHLHE